LGIQLCRIERGVGLDLAKLSSTGTFICLKQNGYPPCLAARVANAISAFAHHGGDRQKLSSKRMRVGKSFHYRPFLKKQI
jgi:hypothetical protein